MKRSISVSLEEAEWVLVIGVLEFSKYKNLVAKIKNQTGIKEATKI